MKLNEKFPQNGNSPGEKDNRFMNFHPMVSICIPTYNRCNYLRKALESMITQEEFLDGRVEIVIADNCSDDGTMEMCEQYARKYYQFNYYRNEENIGSNKNVRHSIELGKGVLLKSYNDDFVHNSDSLRLLCYYEQKYKKTKPLLYFSNTNTERKSYDGEQEKDFESFMYAVSYRMTWQGTFAIWREDLDEFIYDEVGIDKQCWQVEESLDVMEKKRKAIYIDNTIGHRQAVEGKDVSYNIFNTFYRDFLSMLQPFCNKGYFSIDCLEWIRKDILLNFITIWAVNQELGLNSMKYNTTDSLKEALYLECKGKPYFSEVKRKYRKLKIKGIIKKMIHWDKMKRIIRGEE